MIDEIEQDDQIPGVKGQQNKSRGFGFALNGQRVEMEEVFDSAKERLNGGTALAITAFARGRGQISSPDTPDLRRGLANGLGAGSQDFNMRLFQEPLVQCGKKRMPDADKAPGILDNQRGLAVDGLSRG